MNPDDPTSTTRAETPAAGPTDSNDPTDHMEMEEGTRLIIYGGMSIVTDDEGAGMNTLYELYNTNTSCAMPCHMFAP